MPAQRHFNKSELVDALDVSRSTVYKAVRELEEWQLVTKTSDGYQLTSFGRAVVGEFTEFRKTVDRMSDFRTASTTELLENTVPASILREGEFVTPARRAPERPFEVLSESLKGAETVLGFSPVLGRQYLELLEDRSMNHGVEFDIVTNPEIIDYVLAEHRGVIERILSENRLKIWRTESELRYGMVVLESDAPKLTVLVHTERGTLTGLLQTDAPEAIEWGHQQFEEYKNGASRIDVELVA